MPARSSPYAPFQAERPDLPPLPFRVRRATVADAGGVADVWLSRHGGERLAALAGIGAEIRAAGRGEGRLVMVALCEGQVVAYGRARRWSPAEVAGYAACPAGWWLSGTVVLPGYRRRGIGSALMRARLDALGGTVHSRADAANLASLAWHHHNGFVELTRDFDAPGRVHESGPMVLLRWTAG